MKSIKVALAGATGRMGRAIIAELSAHPGAALCAALARPSSTGFGSDAGAAAGIDEVGVMIAGDADDTEFDVMVDFSLPDASMDNLEICSARGKPLMIGTTGFSTGQRQTIENAGRHIPVLLAANTSVGVNLCFKLVELAAATLRDDYDVEVIEAHHRNKVDAPSGTALALGDVLARTLDRDLDANGVFSRHGRTGPRPDKAIGFSVIRAGDIVGEHTVLFANEAERIEITHRAASRSTFARGALRAALWLAGQKPGYYDMRDALQLR